MKSALRLFLLVCVCLSATLVITSQGRKWLVHRLMRDFGSLPSEQREERLHQIAELGPDAVPSLVLAMADDDTGVARTAYELLQRAQNNWSVLDESERMERHGVLVESLAANALRVPDDRTGWGTTLLQQTLMETVDGNHEASRRLFQQANHAMELLSLSSRSRQGRSVEATASGTVPLAAAALDDEDSREPTRLEVRAQPLPVDRVQASELWTQWPPPSHPRFGEPTARGQVADRRKGDERGISNDAAEDSPSVYRSGGKLQPIEPDERIALGSAPDRGETAVEASAVQPTVHLVDSPLETYDDPSVMSWLGSEHGALREKAVAELRRRGYGEEELAIARQLAVADTTARMELVDAIAKSSRLDPRPWLLMLLRDPSRDVRLRAISVLATMNDPLVSQRLQLHLIDEKDPTVAARIRRVLKLR